jgi:hypothetical protein
MTLCLLLVLLIFAVTLFQAAQGFLSAMLMMVLTICALAFGLHAHEWVATHWLSKWKPDYAYAISLALCFGLPLIALRITFDQLIRRSSLVPSWFDRVGGGLCGLVTALVLTGVLALSLQMVPFGESILGFARFQQAVRQPATSGGEVHPVELSEEERELWFVPDRFAVGFAGILSGGVFSGSEALTQREPDYVRHIGWVHTTDGQVSRYAAPGSISVVRTGTVDYVYKYQAPARRSGEPPKYEQVPPKDADHVFRTVRLKLQIGARGTVMKSFLFTLRQIRIVGTVPGRSRPRQFHPIAIQSADENHRDRHVSMTMSYSKYFHIVDELYEPLAQPHDEIEVVFELPEAFQPQFVEYKRGAKAPIAFRDEEPGAQPTKLAETTPPPAQSAPPPPPAEPTPSRRDRSRVRTYAADASNSHFGDALPITLKNYQQFSDTQIETDRLRQGIITAHPGRQEAGTMPPLARLVVPRDKRLLHLSVGALRAGSLYGRAVTQAIATAQSFTVGDAEGRTYKIVGKYVIARVGDEDVMEIQYFPEESGSIGGLSRFREANESNLTNDDLVVFLFLVEPGARITYFSTGGSSMRRDDLEADNLVAPQ